MKLVTECLLVDENQLGEKLEEIENIIEKTGKNNPEEYLYWRGVSIALNSLYCSEIETFEFSKDFERALNYLKN